MTANPPAKKKKLRDRIHWYWLDRLSDGFDVYLDDIARRFSNLSVLVILLASAVGVAIISKDIDLTTLGGWWEGFWQNFGTELFGAFFTFLLIEGIIGAREKRQQEELLRDLNAQTSAQITAFLQQQQAELDEREKQALIDQLSSKVAGLPAEAVRLLKHRGWFDEALTSGVLVDAINGYEGRGNFRLVELKWIQLPGADLEAAELPEADLQEANLNKANLSLSNLKKAYLVGVNMQGVNLSSANLTEAYMSEAEFNGADLSYAKLLGCKYLTIAQLLDVKSLEAAILPDGTKMPKRKNFYVREFDWLTPFKSWCSTLEERGLLDENGYILPAPSDTSSVE